MLASHAYLLHYAIVLARYLLVSCPSSSSPLRRARRGSSSRWPALRQLGALVPAPAAVAALVVLGPLPKALDYPNSFFQHHVYFFEFDERENLGRGGARPGPMPEFYRRLAAEPAGSRTLIEAPWRYESIFNRQPYFQQVHRQRVKIGMIGRPVPAGRARRVAAALSRTSSATWSTSPGPPDVLRREADFVVFHRTLQLAQPHRAMAVRGRAGRCRPSARASSGSPQLFGPPVFEDATITVFALGKR